MRRGTVGGRLFLLASNRTTSSRLIGCILLVVSVVSNPVWFCTFDVEQGRRRNGELHPFTLFVNIYFLGGLRAVGRYFERGADNKNARCGSRSILRIIH